jgi:hypothetical protein
MRLNVLKSGRIAAIIAGTALAASFAATPARADNGVLQCNVSAGLGVIVVSQRNVSCTYKSAAGPVELYTGSISRLGVDIGQITGGTLTYDVYANSAPVAGALAGTYVGPGFGLTLGNGGGANVLIGGGNNSVTLQPLAATTSSGLNINAGIGALYLAYSGAEPPMMRHRHHGHRFMAHHMPHHRHHM